MNGILNVLKPAGMTSFDVVAWLRKVTKIKKIGHTGTLDPMACGVLPVCIGNATKTIEYLVEKDKIYRAELSLGTVTDTQDSYGSVLSAVVPDVSDHEIYEAIKKFRGKLLQVPPMYSALKIGGRKLCDLARQGITLEREPREIEIYSIDIIHINRSNGIKILFDVHCSKGTYIRTLCADLGQALGCGGHMSFLLRKKAGVFDSENSFTIEEIEGLAAKGELAGILAGVDSAFEKFGSIVLGQNELKKFLNGIHVDLTDSGRINRSDGANNVESLDNELLRVYNETGGLIALGELINISGNMKLKSKKQFNITG